MQCWSGLCVFSGVRNTQSLLKSRLKVSRGFFASSAFQSSISGFGFGSSMSGQQTATRIFPARVQCEVSELHEVEVNFFELDQSVESGGFGDFSFVAGDCYFRKIFFVEESFFEAKH